MLVHHRDAELAGLGGAADLKGLSVERDLALVGTHRAVDDLHHRGFARSVLAEDGENFSGSDL